MPGKKHVTSYRYLRDVPQVTAEVKQRLMEGPRSPAEDAELTAEVWRIARQIRQAREGCEVRENWAGDEE